jgi:hypothetical protein
MAWHRNPGPGPTWVEDKEFAAAVAKQTKEAKWAEAVGARGLNEPLPPKLDLVEDSMSDDDPYELSLGEALVEEIAPEEDDEGEVA